MYQGVVALVLMNGTTQAINLAQGAVDKMKSGRDQKSDYEGVTVGGATNKRQTDGNDFWGYIEGEECPRLREQRCHRRLGPGVGCVARS